MSVLIRGMEMPTEEEIGKCIIVRHDGEVWVVEFDKLIDGGYVACYPTNPMRAVPVPKHGRLIDSDALIDWLYDDEPSPWKAPFRLCTADGSDVKFLLKNAPTIIPASEEVE